MLPQHGWIPAFRVESGSLMLADGTAQLRIDRGQLELERKQSFPGPRRVDLAGMLEARLDDAGWTFSTEALSLKNDDLDLLASARVGLGTTATQGTPHSEDPEQ